MTDADQALDLDALLDPARLAAAWQSAHARPVTAREADTPEAFAPEATEEAAETEARTSAREAPLPVALAHRQLLDEIVDTLAALPAIADKARRVLSVPLAQLAEAIDPGAPLDLAAAEGALDQLEDLWQALLSDAGWPKIPDRSED